MIEVFSSKKELKEKYPNIIYTEKINLSTNLFSPRQKTYTLYNSKIFTKQYTEYLQNLQQLIIILAEYVDSRTYFYKKFKNRLKKETKIDETKLFPNNIKDIDSPINFLYNTYYKRKYQYEAGQCINLVFTGKVKIENILQIFLLKILNCGK